MERIDRPVPRRLPARGRSSTSRVEEALQQSCGSGVPKLTLWWKSVDPAELVPFYAKMGEDGVKRYWEKKNTVSIDGRPTHIYRRLSPCLAQCREQKTPSRGRGAAHDLIHNSLGAAPCRDPRIERASKPWHRLLDLTCEELA